MDDEEEVGPAMGGRPKQTKLPNPLNQPKREREAKRKEERVQQEQAEGEGAEQGQAEQDEREQAEQVQLQSKIPPFGDGSQILRDWTTSRPIDDPINQREDTCGSVVFTHLLQVSYNKDKPIAAHRKLSYQDLAHYIKGKTKKKEFSFRNPNIPINYIRSTGLHKDEKISGPGVKTKGDFGQKQDATRQFVYDTLETTPLGIVIENFPGFQKVGMGIYHVPPLPDEKTGEHALLVVGKGITNNGVIFLVAQNSWGVKFGNNGYCRLSLPANGKFKIFWPL